MEIKYEIYFIKKEDIFKFISSHYCKNIGDKIQKCNEEEFNILNNLFNEVTNYVSWGKDYIESQKIIDKYLGENK